MSMIEKVARAMAQVRERNGAAPYDGWDTIHGERSARLLREQLFEEARAAIEALREPTEAMVVVGEQSFPDSGSCDHSSDLVRAWPLMIDAALKE